MGARFRQVIAGGIANVGSERGGAQPMQKAFVAIVSLAVLSAAAAFTADSRRAFPRPPTGSPPSRIALAPAPQIVKAIAVLHPKAGASVMGMVTFSQQGNRVRVDVEIQGLPPNTA